MTTLRFVLAALAAYRLTRLITADLIMSRFRLWMGRRSETLGYLAGCDWCTSIWMAPAPVVATVLWPDNRLVLGIIAALAVSGVVGLIASAEQKLSP